jgi:hypothetical protein
MYVRRSGAIAAAAVVVVGLLCSQWCELNCALFGCSSPGPVLTAEQGATIEQCHGHHSTDQNAWTESCNIEDPFSRVADNSSVREACASHQAVDQSAAPEHCHRHVAAAPDSIPGNHHHGPKCRHEHVVVATLPPCGLQSGVAANSPTHVVADLAGGLSAWPRVAPIAGNGSSQFRSPPTGTGSLSILRI